MSLNIITVTLTMNQDDNGPNFLGISIVGESNKGGDGGIYVGSIMKGGAVAKDGRIEPGDMILQVNDINFENMTNDEAVSAITKYFSYHDSFYTNSFHKCAARFEFFETSCRSQVQLSLSLQSVGIRTQKATLQYQEPNQFGLSTQELGLHTQRQLSGNSHQDHPL